MKWERQSKAKQARQCMEDASLTGRNQYGLSGLVTFSTLTQMSQTEPEEATGSQLIDFPDGRPLGLVVRAFFG